jgi:hypothetical protein
MDNQPKRGKRKQMRRATQSVSTPIQKKTHGDPRRYYVNIEMIEYDEARQKEAQKKKGIKEATSFL